MNLNNKICNSVKSKSNLNLQCPNKCKKNENLCGTHLNSKNIILFNGSINDTLCDVSINISLNESLNILLNELPIESPMGSPCVSQCVSPMGLQCVSPCASPCASPCVSLNEFQCITPSVSTNSFFKLLKDDSKIIYSKDELFEKISNNDHLSIYSIRKSIKKCGLNKTIDTKQSKQSLIKSLKDVILEERRYISLQPYIITIQKNYRRWLVYKKTICCNDTDVLTFSSKYEIPDKFFYTFIDNKINKKYAYDIRTLLEIINSAYPSCPYTFRLFTEDEKKNINAYVNKLKKNGISILIPKKVLTYDEEIEMKIKDVFYQINMLDNYTNHIWFKNLELQQLVSLYVINEDIWNYRSSMDMNSKTNIVKNGIVFNVPIFVIKSIKSKIKLQEIILNDYLKMINEGINRDEKKLGAILILTGLVEVSGDAADALPHLVQ
jgi:hypothetical protein